MENDIALAIVAIVIVKQLAIRHFGSLWGDGNKASLPEVARPPFFFSRGNTALNCTSCLTRSVVKHNYYNVFEHLDCLTFCEEVMPQNTYKQMRVLSQIMTIQSRTSMVTR